MCPTACRTREGCLIQCITRAITGRAAPFNIALSMITSLYRSSIAWRTSKHITTPVLFTLPFFLRNLPVDTFSTKCNRTFTSLHYEPTEWPFPTTFRSLSGLMLVIPIQVSISGINEELFNPYLDYTGDIDILHRCRLCLPETWHFNNSTCHPRMAK